MSDDSDYSADFTDTDSEDEPEATTLKEALVQFYKKHAPKDVHKIDGILEKYGGREAVIFKALRRK